MSPEEDDDPARTVIAPKTVFEPADGDATVIHPRGEAAAAPAVPPAPAPAAGSDNNLPIGTYLGEFELTQVLGEGGFGIVYLARDHSLQRMVALKEYMPSALAARTGGTQVSVKSERHRETFEAGLKSFVNEARLLAQFDHPSLVKVYRFWEANGTAYMVMPFYEGVTLKQQLKDLGGPPDEAWLMELLAPLTEALEVIHREQCYHRDIAPDNVIRLEGSNRPLLLDFGAARRVIGDMTQALTVILKPGYAPVEQYAEVPGMKQGPWTDVYALAAVVYFAIVGKTPPTSVGRLMNDNFVPLAEAAKGRYSERFLSAIDRALAVKPEERTQSIGELRVALGLDGFVPERAAAAPAPRTAAASVRTGAATAPARSRTPLIAGTAVVVLAALAAGGYALLSSSSPPAPAVAEAPPAAAPAPAETPAAPPPAAAAAPAPASFDPVQEMQRIVAAQTPGFTVEGATTHPQFRIGHDNLGLTVTSSRDGYLYVLLAGTDGLFLQLYPNDKSKNNRVRAGQVVLLPEAHWALETAGPPGTDHFVAIVSAVPRDFGATGMTRESGFGFGEFPKDAGPDVLRRHTGAGSPYAGRAVCPSAGPCPDDYGAVYFSSVEVP